MTGRHDRNGLKDGKRERARVGENNRDSVHDESEKEKNEKSP